jgi:hypothetical protein
VFLTQYCWDDKNREKLGGFKIPRAGRTDVELLWIWKVGKKTATAILIGDFFLKFSVRPPPLFQNPFFSDLPL